MKIWGNDISIGEDIWYEDSFTFKYSKVKERDEITYLMPSLIMGNGDRLFVNQYVYTDRKDITNEMIDKKIDDAKLLIKAHEMEKENIDRNISRLKRDIKNLNNFKEL